MVFNDIENNGVIDQSDEILKLLNEICMNEEHSDVTFIVENTKIPAHKTILSLRSSYFHSLIFGGFAETKQAEINLKVPLNAFKVILKYIYTGCLSLANLEYNEIVEIYDLVNQYGFDSVKNTILEYLTINLTLDNCISILNAAHLYSLNELKTSCMKFMDSHSKEFLNHPTFNELPLNSLIILLKRDTFYAPEIEIFKAICNWSTNNPDDDIKEALATVRSSELSTDDLLNVVLQSNILDQTQLLNLMKENSQNTTSRTPSSEKDVDVNFATVEYSAKTIMGENPSALLSGNFTNYDWETDCTYHAIQSGYYHDNQRSQPISTAIIVDLGEVRFINYIKMLLMDNDSRSYSYYVDVSLDGKNYARLIDHSNQYYRSWQFLYFQTRPFRFIKLIGKQIDYNFDCENRKGYYKNSNLSDYYSFDIVGLQAMFKTTSLPEFVGGVIKPTENIAKMEFGAYVLEGFGGNKMLNENPNDFTCHEIGSCIILRFNQPYYISSLRMLLGNNKNHSNKYSFYIETIGSSWQYEMTIDKRDEFLSGWQEFDFKPRSVIGIRIIGTQKDVNFICTYFECPRNPQMPKLKR